MSKRILLIQGHPDGERPHLCHALAAYAEGAIAAGWAEHLVLLFPLWLGDMPAIVYRRHFRAHSLKSLERNILGFVGIAPVHETLIGLVDTLDAAALQQWQAKLRKLGEQAD